MIGEGERQNLIYHSGIRQNYNFTQGILVNSAT